MIVSAMEVWNEAVNPHVYRNSPGYGLIIVHLNHSGDWHHTSKLMASGTTDARALAAKLRKAADDLDALAATIDAETVTEGAA